MSDTTAPLFADVEIEREATELPSVGGNGQGELTEIEWEEGWIPLIPE